MPFKNNLFWPSADSTASKVQKRKPKEKVSAVTTSDERQKYFLRKERTKLTKSNTKKKIKGREKKV